ncbi:MAG: methylated-DNA--[protein]-cysteine S-methyltransferase [Gammaproteobacteria bacterium]|nr:methylated-DNA--[protein]-cysteine S-methyltransferase [Gammaproteobacteria bacterium]MXX94919.1 methylated-DNA--[protein]-cysteine S-methyltransferase [Gammaproteobacteria bacterium]MYF53384.1 methylated-DNA--[protein]-cysteine S-methyltransferase [Gammaproteobacteria bacterium]MYK44111.1 methylated-DNA--[protein]-cysteine S-methyltransferase [Gammaproteobacteria bacterium]
MYYSVFKSPVGDLLLEGTKHALHKLSFANSNPLSRLDKTSERNDQLFQPARQQLTEYFRCERTKFDINLHLDEEENSFHREVWEELRKIPFGCTRSYTEIAQRIGRPKACRAVGQANNRNPISIVIPCHRVIGANGSLTGFGGGLETKDFLLRHEGVFAQK